MVARLLAIFLIVLCVLPCTAPFSTFDSTDSLDGHTSVTASESLAPHASVANPDDDALVLERSTFLRQSRLTALVVTFCDIPSLSAPFVPSIAPSAFIVDSPPVKTILRL